MTDKLFLEPLRKQFVNLVLGGGYGQAPNGLLLNDVANVLRESTTKRFVKSNLLSTDFFSRVMRPNCSVKSG